MYRKDNILNYPIIAFLKFFTIIYYKIYNQKKIYKN